MVVWLFPPEFRHRGAQILTGTDSSSRSVRFAGDIPGTTAQSYHFNNRENPVSVYYTSVPRYSITEFLQAKSKGPYFLSMLTGMYTSLPLFNREDSVSS